MECIQELKETETGKNLEQEQVGRGESWKVGRGWATKEPSTPFRESSALSSQEMFFKQILTR